MNLYWRMLPGATERVARAMGKLLADEISPKVRHGAE
jgi:hypothetical protein